MLEVYKGDQERQCPEVKEEILREDAGQGQRVASKAADICPSYSLTSVQRTP